MSLVGNQMLRILVMALISFDFNRTIPGVLAGNSISSSDPQTAFHGQYNGYLNSFVKLDIACHSLELESGFFISHHVSHDRIYSTLLPFVFPSSGDHQVFL